jgi:hypothetical protein
MGNLERLPSQVLVSNVLDPKAAPLTAFWGMRRIGQFVEGVESDGAEAMPTRWLTIEINYGLANIEESGIISGHLSPREGGFLKAFAHPSPLVGFASWAVLAESANSWRTLGKIQQELKVKTGRKLPVVLYPTATKHPWEEDEKAAERFPQVLFQPCPAVIKIWGVRTPEDLLAEMEKRHYTGGICYDTFHSRCSSKEGPDFLSHWRKFLPKVLDRVKEVHVSAGRIDDPRTEIDTMSELEGLFNPELETELNWILWELYERDWNGRVVIEVPSRALAKRRQCQFLTSEQLTQDYKTIIANVRGILIEGVYLPARFRNEEVAAGGR